MPYQTLEQGIAAIQQGQFDKGARMVESALKYDQIQGPLRAVAYLWLAEARPGIQDKLDCYNAALAADPNNSHAQQRLAQLMAAHLPQTSPLPSAPLPPPDSAPGVVSFDAAYRVVRVWGGPNGPGTGYFVTLDGLLATTRYVVGVSETVQLELAHGQAHAGVVVRAFPALDLALIHTGLAVSRLSPVTQGMQIPPNTPLNALVYSNGQHTGECRETRSRIPADWFPTTFEQSLDAGGAPVFDSQNHLVGMLTRNTNRSSSYLFGLYVHAVYRSVDQYRQEVSAGAGIYCPHCGYFSHVGGMGGFYCERCGAVLPRVSEARRPLPQLAAYYGETLQKSCPNPVCKAQVGYYNGKCLRCGAEVSG